uniref:Beta-carotene isomerase D27-like C-terminal domain-containing protein n=1 Tax=Leersia perrieri TaxID=77586 RepID=A0A0D9WI44_9ORYZ
MDAQGSSYCHEVSKEGQMMEEDKVAGRLVEVPDEGLMLLVFVEKCKYSEESKCLGICISTCKLPTQTFFKDHMGVDLYMEPNFQDYICQVAACVSLMWRAPVI